MLYYWQRKMAILNLKENRLHGMAFDGAIFLGNLALIRLVPRLGDQTPQAVGGAFLLLAVFAQILGAWWKRGFLSRRLALKQIPPIKGLASAFMTLLLFFHFLLFSISALFALGLLGIYDMQGSGASSASQLWVFAALLVGGAATVLVHRAGQAGGGSTTSDARPAWQEFGADGLLWLSISILSRVYWDGFGALIEPARGSGLGAQGLVLLGVTFLLYFFFYLPGRYLFLVEDYRSGWSWVQAFAAMLPVAWLVVVG
jgi:hypothetical protein